MTEEQLSALLRLKRYEQPPTGYYDQLLRDIHRRQREELLQRSLWRIALERVQTVLSAHSMGPLSYAGAVATVAICCAGAIGWFSVAPAPVESGAPLASTTAAKPAPVLSLAPERAVRLAGTTAPVFPATAQPTPSAHRAPRYVIDARPVSYEPSFSF